MASDRELLLFVLQACARSAPGPLYPADFAADAGCERAQIDAVFDHLRLGGFVQLTDWVKGKGQGYALTPAGAAALQQPGLLSRPAQSEQAVPIARGSNSTWDRGEAIRAALLDPGPPIVTMVLLFANLLMYAGGLGLAWMHGIPPNEYFWAETPAFRVKLNELSHDLGSLGTVDVILNHEWWRVLTYQFLHGSLLHLAVNMFSLYMLGPWLEAAWGSKRYLALYLISGVVGGAAVVMAGSAAVGASGAIVGLLTSMGTWLWLNRAYLPERYTSRLMSNVGVNLLILAYISTWSNVSWQGHLGGGIGGVLMSVALQYQRFGSPWQRALSWVGLFLVPLGALGAAFLVQEPRIEEMVRQRQLFEEEHRRRQLHVLLGPQIRGTESTLFKCHNEFVLPLVNVGAARWATDPKFLPNMKQACDDASAKLDSLLAQLAGLDSEDATQAAEVTATRRYFESWRELLRSLESLHQKPRVWNAARLREVEERRDALFELRKPLEQNTIMPGFVPLKKQDATEKLPPNTA